MDIVRETTEHRPKHLGDFEGISRVEAFRQLLDAKEKKESPKFSGFARITSFLSALW